MSSAISTERASAPDDSFRPWQIFALLSMAAAAAIVWVARNTHPLSLILLSLGVLACGFVGYTMFRALSAFLNTAEYAAPVPEQSRDALIREKALLLRSIKELEFDKSMDKIGESDYADISDRLRARALSLMQDIERSESAASVVPASPASVPDGQCVKCGTANPDDAKYCKNCGARL
jgi:zinc-ribbon domain